MQRDRQQRVRKITVCSQCRNDLIWKADRVICVQCKAEFPLVRGVPHFVRNIQDVTKDSEFQAEQMFNNTFTARLYNFGRKLVSSEYMPKDHIREFLKNDAQEDLVIELGSGNRRLREDVINVDLFSFPNVDLVADIATVPFRDSSVDAVILDTVLEHVPEPHRVISEIHRILRPGGVLVCITPFVFPYHGYPRHYANFSRDGLMFLLKDFSECRVEMNMGPTSGMLNLLSEYFAVALSGNSKLAYTIIKGVVLLPVFMLKYIDKLWALTERSINIASHLCAIAKK